MARVSVIVVSNGRPDALQRCLLGLNQIDHPDCEVIVVADAVSFPAIAASGLAGAIKAVAFEIPNISAARNAGLSQAAGDVVAFIDDDAVPEPRWLSHLTAPFDDPAVAAAGGFVRGRNGIDFQWRARLVFADAQTTPVEVDRVRPTLLVGGPGRAVKTEGTNMAVRRSVLLDQGGFDEAFAFYLDETDLNMRLAQIGAATAIVPLAQVHHGFAASPRRRVDRVPRTLFQIGASLAVFLRKHGPSGRVTPWAGRAEQRGRLLRLMVAGQVMPGDVHRLLATFDAGWEAGMARPVAQHPVLPAPPPFQRFPTGPRPHRVILARSWRAGAGRAAAAQAVRDGAIASLYILSPTTLFHRVRFTADGVWEQTGGQFGKSDRSGRLFQPWRANARVSHEVARQQAQRLPT